MSRTLVLGSTVVAVLVAGHRDSSADEVRYQGVVRGGIAATGNSLGLSKANNDNAPGTQGSIGTFMAAGATTQDLVPPTGGTTYPVGTTNDWTVNGSDAVLVLPAASTVVYAELVWGGSYQYGTEDVSAALETSVTLGFGTTTTPVAPHPLTPFQASGTSADGFLFRYYARSADVTAFVAAHGAGTYRVGGVPATQDETVNSLNAAGWSLVVVYRDDASPTRSATVIVGGDFVDDGFPRDYLMSEFCAPPTGTVAGTLVIAAMEGDADLIGDQLAAGPTGGALTTLAGPNNPATNFFASQIDDLTGQLDSTGTFGAANHDAGLGVNAVGARQGWDLAAVALGPPALGNGQTTLTVRASTTGDTFAPFIVGFQVELAAPRFATAGSSALALDAIAVGQTTTLTITLDNLAGVVAARGVALTAPLPAGLVLDGFTVDGVTGDASGAAVDTAGLTTGVDVGGVSAGASKIVVLTLRGVMPGSFSIAPGWSFAFEPCAAQPVTTETTGEVVTLQIVPGDGVPDAGGGTDPGGCCRVGASGVPGDGVLAALVVLGLVRRRRRTR